MLYRENGQFKTTYRADQQIFPIVQDRWSIALLLAIAFIAVPMLASDYMFRAILIPFLIMSLAALGVNILVGYCGQISLGSGAFMAVGAYGAYNFLSSFDLTEGKPIKRVPLPHSYYSVNVSSDGKTVWLGGALSDVAAYDAETLERKGEVRMPDGASISLASVRMFTRGD